MKPKILVSRKISDGAEEILKQEFDYSIIKDIDRQKLLIRPHPSLYSESIKNIDKILSLKLSKKNIDLSEELWKYPIELIANISSFKIIYPKSNKSSVSFYIKNELTWAVLSIDIKIFIKKIRIKLFM